MQLILFEDRQSDLAPLTDFRAVFDIRTGALTTLERHEAVLGHRAAALYVSPALAALTGERHDVLINRLPEQGDDFLLVNGACPLLPEESQGIAIGTVIIGLRGRVVVARVNRAVAQNLLEGKKPDELTGLAVIQLDYHSLLYRPWQVIAALDSTIPHDLVLIAQRRKRAELPKGIILIGDADQVFLHPEATLYPGVVIDVQEGPVAISSGTEVRPGAVLTGPCSIGRDCVIHPNTVVKGLTSIGPHCKLAGEVNACVFQGYANKSHEGFLGHSFVGEWVNFGAGTNGSNLLNTYSEISACVRPMSTPEPTGQTFLGAIIGDHVKFAIGSRISTGAVLHSGSMFATSAFVAGCVGGFTWASDAGQSLYRFDKWIETMRIVMSRRGLEPGQAYLERAACLHESATAELNKQDADVRSA